MTTATVNGATKPSMNEANERDPFNNNSYGTLIDGQYKMVSLPLLDVTDFNERVIRGYEEGWGERDLPADIGLARSLVPAGTATLRDFSNIAPEIPTYIADNCTGCMDCVTECPDTAILGKVLSETEWELKLAAIPEADRAMYAGEWAKTKKYYEAGKKKLGVGLGDGRELQLPLGLGQDLAQDGRVGAFGHAVHAAGAVLGNVIGDLRRDVAEVAQRRRAGGDQRPGQTGRPAVPSRPSRPRSRG